MKNNMQHAAMLLLTSLLWGFNFIAQNEASQYINPFVFFAIRTFLGCLTLIPLIIIYKIKFNDKKSIRAGIILGVWFFVASILQQTGIPRTSIAKAGFISSLYVVFIPIIELLFFHKNLDPKITIYVVLSLTGLFLLFNMKLSFSSGDILIFVATIFFSIHMISISRFSNHNGIVISFVQFATSMILSFIASLFFEAPSISNLINAAPSLIYAGVFSGGVAYTLQIIGQRDVDSTIAAICLSLESVFATFFGFIILKQSLSLQELIGCFLMLSSVILSQLHR